MYPLSDALADQVAFQRAQVQNIIEGIDPRKLLIVGPCSAWPNEAVLEYSLQLQDIAEKVKDQIMIVLRCYIQKPRTTVGWAGPLTQPDPLEAPNIEKGIQYCRSMMLKALEMGLPLADEALFTHNGRYFGDLLSYVAIGARSTENAEHRYIASGMDFAVGMKNPTSGDIDIGINSVVAARHPHIFAVDGFQTETSGNPHAHLILRGGAAGPNYSTGHLLQTLEKMEQCSQLKGKNHSLIVDASHDNLKDAAGKKDPLHQPEIVFSTLASMQEHPELRPVVTGWMVESFLKDGSQPCPAYPLPDGQQPTLKTDGLSITDPCISLQKLAGPIQEFAYALKQLA